MTSRFDRGAGGPPADSFATAERGADRERRERDRDRPPVDRLREGVALSQQAMRLLRAGERARDAGS